MSDNTPIIQHTTVADSVYLWIKNAIIHGEFEPGEHIAQETLTKRLGVSRTPVRDAMRRLEAEGLVINKPHRGAVVFQLSKEHLIELYEVRILLEQYCAAKTCLMATEEQIQEIEQISMKMADHSNTSKKFMQLDRQFHTMLCAISSCTNSLEILDGLWNKCDSFKAIYYSLEGKAEDTLADHAQMVLCLKNRDSKGIKKAISDHLKDVVSTIYSTVNLI